MGKTVSLQGKEVEFARRCFESYYQRTPPVAPPNISLREFAFSPFEEGAAPSGQKPHLLFIRHKSIRDGQALGRALAVQAPRHAYYSTAHYERPDHPSMKDKGWIRADLVFDLDADHLREAEGKTYQGQLELARERFRYLLDEYIFGDFGLSEEDVTLTFSGGRGYHAHVHSEPFQRLSGGERRELVDYAMGTGFEPNDDAFQKEGGQREDTGRATGREYLRLYPTSEPGWKGRISRGIHQWIEDHRSLDPDTLAIEIEKLLSAGRNAGEPGTAITGEKGGTKPSREAKSIASDLSRPETQRAILEMETLESFPHDKTGEKRKDFLEAIVRTLSVQLQGEMDAPVTTDVHRLIRMPGSLHGGTGFMVKPLTREALDSFDPLRDALVPEAILTPMVPRGSTLLALTLTQDVDYRFGEERQVGKSGERVDVTLAQGLFLVLRGEAALGDILSLT